VNILKYWQFFLAFGYVILSSGTDQLQGQFAPVFIELSSEKPICIYGKECTVSGL